MLERILWTKEKNKHSQETVEIKQMKLKLRQRTQAEKKVMEINTHLSKII